MKKSIIYLIIAIFLINTALAQIEIIQANICNGDNTCNNKENHQNCPQDCLSGQKDNYCDNVIDDICDPDCSSQADSDCEPKTTLWQRIVYAIKKPFIDIKSSRPAMQKAYYIIIAGSATLIVAIIILLIISALKIDKYRKQRLIQEIKGIKMPKSKPPKIKELLKPEKKTTKKEIMKKETKKKVEKKQKIAKEKPVKIAKAIKSSPGMQEYYDVLEKPVKRLISAGYKKEAIKTRLEKEKWPKEVLDLLFKKI
ncbi:hypothetical protein KY331_04355 [Candidatus Woesearchaeota archaeon]|nr:hypothetical protein [Candidatus Woesearchaeota archaeon]